MTKDFFFYVDSFRFKRMLNLKNKHKKEFFNKNGCGLEIEFGVNYSHVSSAYIRTGLMKLKQCVDGRGKFVTDNTIGCDMNFEIVLNPQPKEELKNMVLYIKEILGYYENFVLNEHCGVHANFLADAELKKAFYDKLVAGYYKPEMFTHNKYKVDFLEIAVRDGRKLSYEEFESYQKNVSAKYTGVNFLKPGLIEFRALSLDWDRIEYVIDLYEEIKNEVSLC